MKTNYSKIILLSETTFITKTRRMKEDIMFASIFDKKSKKFLIVKTSSILEFNMDDYLAERRC